MKQAIIIFLLLVAGQLVAVDPSLKAHPDVTGKKKFAERYRVVADLDGNGVDDMLLSGGVDQFGSMGGPWVIYVSRGGRFVAIGEIWAHPMAIAIELDQDRIKKERGELRFVRIWVYLKSSGRGGALGYYRVAYDFVEELKSVEIYAGDGGSVLGRALFDATFKSSPVPFRVQRSVTGEDGVVRWVGFEG